MQSDGDCGSKTDFMKDPAHIAVHEAFHFLGCDHGFTAKPCKDQIERSLRAAKHNRENGQDFFPAMLPNGKMLRTRSEVDRLLAVKQGRDDETTRVANEKVIAWG